ncbi:unnamed protein product, partial [Polarella glacialis]
HCKPGPRQRSTGSHQLRCRGSSRLFDSWRWCVGRLCEGSDGWPRELRRGSLGEAPHDRPPLRSEACPSRGCRQRWGTRQCSRERCTGSRGAAALAPPSHRRVSRRLRGQQARRQRRD